MRSSPRCSSPPHSPSGPGWPWARPRSRPTSRGWSTSPSPPPSRSSSGTSRPSSGSSPAGRRSSLIQVHLLSFHFFSTRLHIQHLLSELTFIHRLDDKTLKLSEDDIKSSDEKFAKLVKGILFPWFRSYPESYIVTVTKSLGKDCENLLENKSKAMETFSLSYISF